MPKKPSETFGKTKPTIVDVARYAGVSAATVSYVLNGRFSQVSPKTVDKVKQAVEQLGYVKNLTASSLSSRRSNLIAVIVLDVFDPRANDEEPEINPFYGEFLFRLEREARQRGYAVCLYTGREEEAVHFLLQRHVNAAVLVGFSPRDLPSVLNRKDMRLVLFDSYIQHDGVDHVRTDDEKGGALAAEHMLSIGRKTPVFLGGYLFDYPDNIPAFRYRGAKAVFDKAGVEAVVMEGPTTFTGGFDAAKKIIAMGADCVVATADIIAAGVIEGLRQQGVKVPDDVAITGYDNLPVCEHIRPRITTVDQRLSEKVKAVVDLIDDKEHHEVRVVEPRLVQRDSA